MTINVSFFHKVNVVDSCSIWNILSSNTLHVSCVNASCDFVITGYVEYECLYKPRSKVKDADERLKKKLNKEKLKGKFQTHNLSINDLQDITSLEKIQRLGIGELSSIAFAKKINQAFMSDDQKARKLAEKILGTNKVQTTPHLLGWLVFTNELNDSDISIIKNEHKLNERPLEKYFDAAYKEALRVKMLTR